MANKNYDIKARDIAWLEKNIGSEKNAIRKKRYEIVYMRSQYIPDALIRETVGVTQDYIAETMLRYRIGGLDELDVKRGRRKNYLEIHKAAIKKAFEDEPPDTLDKASKIIKSITGIQYDKKRTSLFLKKIGLKFINCNFWLPSPGEIKLVYDGDKINVVFIK